MNRTLCLHTFLGLAAVSALLAFASPAVAGGPDPTKSHADPVLFGDSSGNEFGNVYHVSVRTVGGNPVPGAPVAVSIIFYPAASARPLLQQEAGTMVDCNRIAITRYTDSQCNVVFDHVRIAGFSEARTAQVRANGVLLNTVPIRSTDMNADGATDLSDLNWFRNYFLHNPYPGGPADFNQDGVTTIADLQIFRSEFFSGARGTLCP